MEFEKLYPELQNSTEMIRALLLDITQEASQVKPDSGWWSILEVVCHLYDEEREDFREHLDFILHRQQEAWHEIDPQGWVKQRSYNEQDFSVMQEKFFLERANSLDWLKQLHRVDWDTPYVSQFGSTTAGQMLACWVAHDNLHVRQLAELRRFRIQNITRPHNLEYAGDW